MLLSLCIPTNGVLEWVLPVLESIYNQNVDESLYEVIVSDNGNSEEFRQALESYKMSHSNLIYKKTYAQQFMNQVEAFKMASGEFIKFVNHRDLFVNGTVEYLIRLVQNNLDEKPVMFFSNGTRRIKECERKVADFDEFIRTLSYMSSWSGGTAIWKRDFEKIPEDYEYNILFPHTGFLFAAKSSASYIVSDRKIFQSLKTDETKKGNYKLYKAFGVDFPNLVFQLEKEKSITKKTCNKVMQDMKFFLAQQYMEHEIMKNHCSYDLQGFQDYVGIYFHPTEIIVLGWMKYTKKRILHKFFVRK